MEISQESIQRAKVDFYLDGRSVAEWARENNFRQGLVYAVLSGRSKALRGESHRIAVQLGLKPKRETSVEVEADQKQ